MGSRCLCCKCAVSQIQIHRFSKQDLLSTPQIFDHGRQNSILGFFPPDKCDSAKICFGFGMTAKNRAVLSTTLSHHLFNELIKISKSPRADLHSTVLSCRAARNMYAKENDPIRLA